MYNAVKMLRGTHTTLETHCGEHPALGICWEWFEEENRDHPHSITTTFRECRLASPEAILGQCWGTTLPLQTTRADRPEKAHGRSGASMNHPIQASFRSSAAVAARQTFLTPVLTALAAIAAVSDSASAQTAFTLPAPAFELPMVPSVSGNWTVMVGVGGEYKPDFVGANRSMLSPVPIFSIRRAGSAEQFRGPRDSASIALIDFGDLRAGPT